MDCVVQPFLYNQFTDADVRVGHPCNEATHYNGTSMETFWGDAKLHNGKPRLVVIGHRGCGKNKRPGSILHSERLSIMENTIISFNHAAECGADFVEFDVQVTKDGCPIIFHDDSIVVLTDDQEGVLAKRIPELTLEEFLSIGCQKNPEKPGKVLLREAFDGNFAAWTASIDDSLCTLQDAFEHVTPSIGFNIELKFHDTEPVDETEIRRTIDATLQVVEKCAAGRKIYFSSFHPDAVQILRNEQSASPVFFLTDGGVNIYVDPRRNSIESAIQVCREGRLQGIVSEVRAILQNPQAVNRIHEAGLCLLTYGELNNIHEALHKQEENGVDGVIVDHVQEMVAESRKTEQTELSELEHSNKMSPSRLLPKAIPTS